MFGFPEMFEKSETILFECTADYMFFLFNAHQILWIFSIGGWGEVKNDLQLNKYAWNWKWQKLLIGNFLRGIHSVLPAVKTWFGLHYTAICKNYCGINNVNREFTSCNIASLSFRLYYLWYYTRRSVQICKHIAMVSIPWPRICSTHCNGQHSLTSSGMLPWKQDVKKYNLVYHWITLYSRQSHNYTSNNTTEQENLQNTELFSFLQFHPRHCWMDRSKPSKPVALGLTTIALYFIFIWLAKLWIIMKSTCEIMITFFWKKCQNISADWYDYVNMYVVFLFVFGSKND